MTVSVLIPVYNAPDRVEDLLESLLANSSQVLEILVGDDCSDSYTQGVLAEYAERSSLVKIFRNEVNLGYLGNVNNLYRNATGDIAVLLNSDTLVPSGWDRRVVDCFSTDSRIALAIPLSTNANYVVLRPSFGQSWQDLDLARQAKTPGYFDLPGTVGFCLAIRRSLIPRQPLLNVQYNRGYWEDTELHYYVKSLGLRSVCIDNLLVYHANGSSSFSISDDLKEINDTNRAIFMRQFGREYTASFAEYERNNPMTLLRYKNDIRSVEQIIDDLDFLFILPAFKRGIGGVHVVLRLIEIMQLRGIRASLYVYGEVDWSYVEFLGFLCPFLTEGQIRDTTPKIRQVVATSHDSFMHAEKISRKYGAKLVYFVQGPEAAFGNGAGLANVLRDYRRSDQVVTVSPFLQRYVKDIANVDSTFVRMGPHKEIFYPRTSSIRKPKTIAACIRPDALKGTGHMLYNAALAQQAGFELHFFGKPLPRDLAHLGVHHGELAHREIAKLLSEATFYLDCSLMEGLGLLPLEAAFCGAIPIVMRMHGLDHILVDRKNCFILPKEFDNAEFFRDLHNTCSEQSTDETGGIGAVATAAFNLRNIVNEQLGYLDFIEQCGCATQQQKDVRNIKIRIWPKYAGNGKGERGSQQYIWQQSSGGGEYSNRFQHYIESILVSRSWRLTRPLRVAGSLIRGHRYSDPMIPGDAASCEQLLIALLSSSSWAITFPVRKLGAVFRRIR